MVIIDLMNKLQATLKMGDAALSKYLQTDPTTISKVRAGESELPMHCKHILLDNTGFFVLAKKLNDAFAEQSKGEGNTCQERAILQS